MSEFRKALKPCASHGCSALVRSPERYCIEHKPVERKQTHQRYAQLDPQIDEHKRFYQSSVWRKCRAMFLRAHPCCVACGRLGNVVDHMRRLRDGGERLDPNNLQTMCSSCHNKKRQSERYQ